MFERNRKSTVILGGGLGYLPEAILDLASGDHFVAVLEPDVGLWQLGRCHRPDAAYFNSTRIGIRLVPTPSTFSNCCQELTAESGLIVSPYFLRLAQHDDTPIAGFVQILRSEMASRHVYDTLISTHTAINGPRLAHCPSALNVRLLDDKLVCVCGAGPSLTPCLASVKRCRAQVIVVAASGAVPSLLQAGIEPDWIIALEGRESIVNDLSDLRADSHIIAFEVVNPAVLERFGESTIYRGDGVQGLETRGGSSLIPAVDFALRTSTAEIALLGADLSLASGLYAGGAKRDASPTDLGNPSPPKFASMRAGIERLLSKPDLQNRTIFHVLPKGRPLRGTSCIEPSDLEERIGKYAAQTRTHV
ncbi:DUF115 domain-containing protein [bacterium]|nr:DUF115 domain-containing protein [bacterium]